MLFCFFRQEINYNKMDPYLLSVYVALIRMLVGFITSQLLYKFGRRILCLCSLMSMAVIMFVSGSCVLLVHKSKYLLI